MRDIYNMIIRRALSEVKKKIRPRPPGGSRFGFKPGPGSRAGGKGFVPVHECRTAGRCDLFDGQLMLTGLQADIGIQLCQGGVHDKRLTTEEKTVSLAKFIQFF